MRRLLILVMLASVLLAACQSAATPTPTAAPKTEAKPAASPPASGQAATAASPAASPKVSASPSPSPAAAGATGGGSSTWAGIRDALTSNLTLLIIGIVLAILAIIAWSMSNRAEATPNEDQVAEMHHFVNDHFAKYVARGLAAEGVGPLAVSQDPAWRNVYLQHLRLHNELHPFVPPRHSPWGPIISFACGGPVGIVAMYFMTDLPGREPGGGRSSPSSSGACSGSYPCGSSVKGSAPRPRCGFSNLTSTTSVSRELEALTRGRPAGEPGRRDVASGNDLIPIGRRKRRSYHPSCTDERAPQATPVPVGVGLAPPANTPALRTGLPCPATGAASDAPTESEGHRPRSAARTPRPASPGTGSRGWVSPPPSP